MEQKVFGIVLAGGRGRRLGGLDKAAIIIGGSSTLTRAKAALSFVDTLAVSGRDGEGAPQINDAKPSKGPLAGLAAGLNWSLEGGAEWLATAPTDMPFLSASIYRKLLVQADGADVVIASDGSSHHWLVAIWSARLAHLANASLEGNDLSIAKFAKRLRFRILVFPGEQALFANINTEADLESVRKNIARDDVFDAPASSSKT